MRRYSRGNFRNGRNNQVVANIFQVQVLIKIQNDLIGIYTQGMHAGNGIYQDRRKAVPRAAGWRNYVCTTCNKREAHQYQEGQENNEESLHVLGLQTYWTETGFVQFYDFINSGDLLLLQRRH